MDYLDEGAVLRVLRTLIARTSDGRSTWTAAQNDFEFKTLGKSFTYFIASGDKDDLPPFVFEIWRGDPLTETHDPSDAQKLQTVETKQFSDYNEALRELYFSAKRAGMDLEGVASEILSDLD